MPIDKESNFTSKSKAFVWLRKHYFPLAIVLILAAMICARFNVALSIIFSLPGIILCAWAWACDLLKEGDSKLDDKGNK